MERKILAADGVVDDLEEFASLVWNVIRGYARWVDVLCITYVLTDYSMWEPEHTVLTTGQPDGGAGGATSG